MGKLIKLSDDHYIIVDNSEINVGCWFYNQSTNYIGYTIKKEGNFWVCANMGGFHLLSEAKKITHSTKPLEQYYGNANGEVPYVYHRIREIKVSDIEKLVYGYSVEEMSYKYCDGILFKDNWKVSLGKQMTISEFIRISKMAYIAGFKAYKELQFNDYQDGIGEGVPERYIDNIMGAFVVQTEWDIEINELGKIKIV
jgi:hypothetical protein